MRRIRPATWRPVGAGWCRLVAMAGALAGLTGGVPALAQPSERITTWRASDGLPQSSALGISLGNRGRVLVTPPQSLPLARLDGYGVLTLTNAAGAPSRVYENRSGQLWCVTADGLLEQLGNGWNQHPVPEIAAEYRATPMRAVRAIPLLPLERNRVLLLLPNRLIEYDAAEHRTTAIRSSSQTRLEHFNDFAPSEDGVWISGRRGLLHITGPLRQLRPDSPAEEFDLPERFGAIELQRPHVAPDGSVVAAAEQPETRERHVARLRENRWQIWPVPGQMLRQAWTGADGQLWAHTPAALLRLDQDRESLRPRVVLQAGRIADVAIEPAGAMWLATSEGVHRVAPLPWRIDDNLSPAFGAVLAVTSDQRGRLVAVTDRAVHALDGAEWHTTQVFESLAEELARLPGFLFPLADGGLLVHGQAGNLRFDANLTVVPEDPAIAAALPLGRLPDGRVLLADLREAPGELLSYDGRSTRSEGRLPADVARVGSLAFALQTRGGELWLGGGAGLLVRRGDGWFGPNEEASGTTPGGAGARDDGALAGLELPNGRVLIGGFDTVREFDGRSWTVLRRGLDRVHALQVDRSGAVWIASGSGLHRIRDRSWLSLGEEEGLPASAVFGVFEDGVGRLWAATGRGLASFDPRTDPDSPLAYIVSAEVPERGGDARAMFVVGGEDRWRYAPAGRLLFSWRLDNEPWSIWRAASAVQFTNVAAGSHRFQVRAMDPCGNEQSNPANFDFEVALPWFRDPRLVASSVALVVAVLALAAQAVISYFRLKRSYAEVELQVAERSAALERANAELLLSQKMRALGTLAAGVAHDFNNLLSIIRGSAQLAEGSLEDREKTRQRLQRIRTAVDQGAGLVKAMLGYSRGASAQRRRVDVVATVQQAVRLLDEDIGARVDFQAPPSPGPTLTTSAEMLQQILLNLIQNAAEASDKPGRIDLEVVVCSQPPADCVLKPSMAPAYIEIRVSDHGIGIPPENLPRIFEPFFTTKAFSSRRGTGLGLSMVYEFAKELGAGLSVRSAVREGTTFRVVLPQPQETTG